MTAVFENEVVTRAFVRYLRVPGSAGELALITLDNGHDHTRPSTFGPGGLASLDAALDGIAAHSPAPVAIAVTGKPFIFAVGADLSGFAHLTDAAQAREMAATGHRVFRRLKDSAVPTFAFVNGAALGGGLELALHCHYRSIATTSVVAFPEVFLGLVPGWGGTQLLPNLIGIAPAAQVILQNPLTQKTLKPAQARELGIADEIFEPADYLERSLAWAEGVVDGTVTVIRPEIDRDMWDGVLFFARKTLDDRLHGAVPSAYRALDLLALAKEAPFAEGAAAEAEAIADLVMSEELRAGLYAFDLVQRRAKRPAGAPPPGLAREVTKVGIVGAGLMASQLALLFA
ncbi:MAG TPA: enoyl-CoA hydratase-related protein, partial [Nocardioides sp.]|nr:enoyl-CoA hydratase-related protein [Nocardioides sp.]